MIKNIIFDVGDVLVEYRWMDMMMDYGLSPEDARRVGTEMFDSYLWADRLDLGLLTVEEVIREYHKEFPQDGDLIEWFILHGEQMYVPRPEVWEKVARLKRKGYKIYILSNYSEYLFKKHTDGASFWPYIDGKVVSYEIHKGKPDPEIYHHLLNQYAIKPEESLFLDDRAENIAAAEKLGIHGIQVTSREFLNQELDRILAEKDS